MRTRSAVLLLGLAPLALAAASCNDENAAAPAAPAVVTEIKVDPGDLAVGQELTATITLRNEGSKDAELQFADGRQFALELHGPDGRLARRSVPHIQATTRLTVPAGGAHVETIRCGVDPQDKDGDLRWDPGVDRLPPGTYTVTGGLVLRDVSAWAAAELRIVAR